VTNILGTISAFITIILGVMVNVLGCKVDAITNTEVCTASFLPPWAAGVAMVSFAVLTLLSKILRPGGGLHGLIAKTAVVVPDGQGKPGVVTPSQVKSPHQ
jgi:hypothetical protein